MKLSVIVCTYNRSHAIGACLDSIAESLVAATPVEAEIIVVDNASTDDTAAVIKKWAATCAFPVQALHEPKKGVSAARNCAIRAARGDLLVFTDDDCRLSKNHVIDALRHDETDTEPVLRGGCVELGDITDIPLTIKNNPAPARWHWDSHSRKDYDGVTGSMVGCNMVMRRTVANTIGFFDENIGPGTSVPAAEDTDFILRAYNAGIVIEYVPDMTVFHFHGRKTVSDGYKLLRSYTIGGGALYMKYFFKDINLCRQFYYDSKDVIKEMITGKKGCRPEFGFTYKHKAFYSMLGAFKYCLVAIRKAIA